MTTRELTCRLVTATVALGAGFLLVLTVSPPALRVGFWVVAVAAGATSAVALLFAPERQWSAIATQTACGVLSPLAWPPLWVTLFRVGHRGRLVATSVGMGGSILAATLSVYVVCPATQSVDSSHGMTALSVVAATAFIGSPLTGYVLWQQYDETSRLRLQRIREQDRAETALAHAQREERAQLAQELHDLVGNRLATLSLLLYGVVRTSELTSSDREILTRAVEQIEKAKLDLQLLVSLMSSDAMPVHQSADSLQQLFDDARHAGVDVRPSTIGQVDILSPSHALTLDRFFREGLTNVMKYAASGAVFARIEVNQTDVQAQLTSPVRKTTSASRSGSGTGRGLLGLQQRALLLGGRVWHETDGSVFILRLSLPLPAGTQRSHPR